MVGIQSRRAAEIQAMEQAVSNAAGALDGLKALEDEAMAAHKRVDEALDGCRGLLIGAIIERYGKNLQDHWAAHAPRHRHCLWSSVLSA